MSHFVLPILMAALLAVGAVAYSTEQAGLASSTAKDQCPTVQEGTLPEGDLEGIPLDARITEITPELGLLEVETDLGTLQALAAPEEIRDLKAGDRIVVCVMREAEESGVGIEG